MGEFLRNRRLLCRRTHWIAVRRNDPDRHSTDRAWEVARSRRVRNANDCPLRNRSIGFGDLLCSMADTARPRNLLEGSGRSWDALRVRHYSPGSQTERVQACLRGLGLPCPASLCGLCNTCWFGMAIRSPYGDCNVRSRSSGTASYRHHNAWDAVTYHIFVGKNEGN